MTRLDLARAIVDGLEPAVVSPDPKQRPGTLYYPDLPHEPIFDSTALTWVDRLKDAYGAIRTELDSCLAARQGFEAAYPAFVDSGGWATMWFYLYGQRFEENCRRCPETVKVIESVPRLAGWASYSAVAPGTHLRAHCGATNAKLRLHFTIRSDMGSRLRVADRFYEWREGDVMVFDDSYEHEVWASGSRTRIVLILDFYHPDLSDEEVQFLEWFESTPSPLLANESVRSKYQKVHRLFRNRPGDADWVYNS